MKRLIPIAFGVAMALLICSHGSSAIAFAGDAESKAERVSLGVGLDSGPKGIVVTSVPEESEDTASGLKVGDEIETVNGKPLLTVDALMEEIQKFADEGVVELEIRREGELLRRTVRLTREQEK